MKMEQQMIIKNAEHISKEEDIYDIYKRLNEKCDEILEKIKKRRNNDRQKGR